VVSAAIARALESWGSRLGRTLGPEDVEVLTAALAERGRRTSAAELLGAIDGVHAFGRRLAAWWDATCDLLLTPTTAAPPPEIGVLTSTPDEPFRAFLRAAPYGAFSLPFNMSGQPAISLPGRPTPDGMPLGIQLVAPYGREDLLLRVAATMEEAAPWAERRPRLHA
jgi:amidase